MRAVKERTMGILQLKEIQVSQLVETFSKDALLSLYIENLKSNEIDGHEVFQLFVQKLLIAYGEQLTKGDWITLISCLKQSFQRLLKETLNEKLLQLLACWFREAALCLQWLHTTDASILPWPNRCLLLGFVLCIVIDFLAYYKQRKNVLPMQQLVENVLLLHNETLKWLETHADTFKITNEMESRELHEVVDALCTVGEQTTLIDFKSIIETWKSIIKLLGLYSKPEFSGASTYGQRAINFLLRQIRNNMQTVYTQQTMQKSLQQIEKYLKVTNFFLKLLQRLFDDLPHEKRAAAHEFCKTYFSAKIMPAHFKHTAIGDLVEKHVFIVLNEIFTLVYKHADVAEFILQTFKNNIEDKTEDDFILPIAYFRVMVADADAHFIASNAHNCIALHAILSKTASEEYYETFVELYAALAVLCETPALRKHLRRQIFVGDFCIANSSMDILCTMLNYINNYDANAHELLLPEFHYWRKCNDLFAVPCSQQMRHIYVQQLLCYCHALCQANARIANSPEWQQGNSRLSLTRSNYNFVLTIGLQAAVSHTRERTALTEQIAHELLALLSKRPANYSMKQFNKMLMYVELLCTSDASITVDILSRLLALVDANYNNTKFPTEMYTFFLNATYKLAATALRTEAITESAVSQALQSIEKQQNRIEIINSVHLYRFLQICCKYSSTAIRQKATQLLHNISAQCTKHAETWPLIYAATNSQVCNSSRQITVSPGKRPRLESAENDLQHINTLLQEFSCKSMQVVDLSNNFDHNDCVLLRRIVNDLNVLLANKK